MIRFQPRKTFFPLLAGLALGACSHDLGQMKLEEQTNLYGSAIRWSAFPKALEFFVRPPKPMPDPRLLKDIEVTGYRNLHRLRPPDDENTVIQTVEIRYIHKSDQVERKLNDEQVWHYDDQIYHWRLESGFPKFE
jgi:hypothetical protein